MSKEQCFFVSPGDIVQITLFDNEQYETKVLAVTRRYGRINHGSTRQNPLLHVQKTSTGELISIDNGYVTGIVSRYQGPRSTEPVNVYRGEWQCIQRIKRGVLCSTLPNLVQAVLAKLPFPILFHADFTKIVHEYQKQNIGLIKKNREIYYVREKYFARWVRQNAHRLLRTAKEVDAERTVSQIRWEDDYWRSVEEEQDRWLNEQLTGGYEETDPYEDRDNDDWINYPQSF